MVKKIIHVSDIHIRNFKRLSEYSEQLNLFIEKVKEETNDYQYDEIRIVISGDICHQKTNISPELMVFASSFIRELEKIGKVIVIAGNHDLLVNNTTRTDAITAIFDTAQFENAYFLDQMLEYQSGYVIDENVTWVVYSIYDNFRKPTLDDVKNENPNNIVIGLFHGVIVGSTLYNGTVMDEGCDGNLFNDCNIVMAGDIHKRQEFKRGDTLIVYPGSLIQQTFGETITQHGFCVWDLENKNHKFVDIDNDYGLYKIEIKTIYDIDNDDEILVNY